MSASGTAGESYDVVVVGTGLGGLSAAACLARAGKRVLAVERSEEPGGYARPFRRGDYVFDPAIHVTPTGFGGLDFWEVYLTVLGIRDRVELIKAEPFYGMVLPDLRFQAPPGIEPFIEAHVEAFPGEADGIERFVRACVQITAETQSISTRLTLDDLGEAMKEFPFMFKYRTSTLQEALEEYVGDTRVRAVLGAAWPYLGVEPSRLSFVQYAAMLAALMEKGPGYVKGSFGSLADALASVVEENGGTLLTGTTVERIEVADGAVRGVSLDGGRQASAPVVVSNANARQTLEQLVGAEHLPERYMRRLARMKPSLSAFAIYAATTLDVPAQGLAHETFVYRHWDHDDTYADVLAGRLGGTWLSLPTIHDPSLAPAGEHLVVFTSMMPYEAGAPWEQNKQRYIDEMVARVEELMPGFRDGITYLTEATPETFERYTLNTDGAVYGWENIPQQSLPKRLAHKTPVEGLFLSGHWTEPGSSSFRVVYSGVQAAQSILGYDSPVDLFGALYEAGAAAGSPAES